MRYKEDWAEAKRRWCALWEGRSLDRPCVVARAPRDGGVAGPPPPGTPEQKWLDPEWVLPDIRARLANTYWGGEAVPSYHLHASSTICCGARPRLTMETIWRDPVPVDMGRPPSFRLDFDDIWLRKFDALFRAVVKEAGRDDFLIGQVWSLPGSDMLPAIMGDNEFLLATVDEPEWVKQAILQLARNRIALHRHFEDGLSARSSDYWYGIAGWAPFWGPERFVGTQSDVSCMVSPEMFAEFILPEIQLLGEEFERVWYHLDGPGALKHLPALLRQDFIEVIQWVPGVGAAENGPEWMDVYKRIQAAGKIVHIELPPGNIEPLMEALDPGRICFQTWCRNVAEAEQLLGSMPRRMKS